MSPASTTAARLFDVLAGVSWQVAALVGAVLIVQRVFGRRLASRWHYALWLLVFARLCVPIVPRVSLGVVPWNDLGATSIESRAPDSTPGREAATVIVDKSSTARRPTQRPPRAEPRVASPPLAIRGALPKRSEPAGWRLPLVLIWAAGALLLLLRLAVSEYSFKRRLGKEAARASGPLQTLVRDCGSRAGVTREVRVFETELVATPAISGFRQPALLLPKGLHERLGDEALRHVVYHELAHVRRGDVLTCALLSVVATLYWFHPLVWFALARVRGAQESLRDHEALALSSRSSSESRAPAAYARTLLAVLDAEADRRTADLTPTLAIGLIRNLDLKRRILMIRQYDPRNRSTKLGAALCLGLAWLSFLSATSAPAQGSGAAGSGDASLDRIRVERIRAPMAEWQARMEAKLDQRVDFELEKTDLRGLVSSLSRTFDLNVLLDPEVEAEFEGAEFSGSFADIPLRQVLNLLLEQLSGEIAFGPFREVLWISYTWRVPVNMELRLYGIEPLLAHEESYAEDLETLLYSFTGDSYEDWEQEYVRINFFDGVMSVQQTPSAHAHIEAFLNRLLNRGTLPNSEESEHAQVFQTLANSRIDVDLEGQSLAEAVEFLNRVSPVPIRLDRRLESEVEEPVELELQGTSIANVLAWMVEPLELSLRTELGVVVIGYQPQLEVAMFEIGELDGLVEDDSELYDAIEWTVRDNVQPAMWDEYVDAAMVFWGDMMIVRATPEANAEIKELVSALGRMAR